jgi:hypothetical protein
MLNSDQRRRRADKLADLGNLAAGALIFGQVLSSGTIRIGFALLDVAILISAYIYGNSLLKYLK